MAQSARFATIRLGVYILFGMAIYIAVKYPNFLTGYYDNVSKTTTKTVPKTVRNGLNLG
jgi:hypothetical protein